VSTLQEQREGSADIVAGPSGSPVADSSMKPGFRSRALTVANRLEQVLGIVVAVLVGIDVLVVFLSVAHRAVLGSSFIVAQEASTVLLVSIAFLGGVTAYYREEHVGLAGVAQRWPLAWRPTVSALRHGLVVVFMVAVGWYTIERLQFGHLATLPATGWGGWVLYLPLVVSSALIVIIGGMRLIWVGRSGALWGVGLLILLSAAAWFAYAPISAIAGGSLAPFLAAAVFLAAMALGVPIAFDLGLAALVLIYFNPSLDPSTIPIQMVGGIHSFILLALPFFVLAGGILATGGIASRLVRLIEDLTSRWRGGSAISAVLAMYLFSGLSGSKVADIAAVSPVLTPAMLAKGHSDREVVGIFATSAVMGETVPPSLAILVLASVATISTGALFLAGLAPAGAVGLCLIAAIYWRARRSGIRSSAPPPLSSVVGHLWSAVIPLGMPVMIFGGIIGGIATPIEASALAVVYGILISATIYRVSVRELARVTFHTARLSAMICFLLATAALFAWVLSADGVSRDMQTLALYAVGFPALFIIASIILLTVAGAIFEGLPALVLFGPILLPVATAIGIDPLQYSVVLIMSMGLGGFMPPLGVGYYATCAITTGVAPERAIRTTLSYLAVAAAAILLIGFVPIITTFLPTLVLGR
jgi:tripartite ATP-independent transporter DctM subunit